MRTVALLTATAGVIACIGAGTAEAATFPTSGFSIWTIAGTGTTCASPGCGDGGPATSAQFNGPTGVAVDGAGNVYIADASTRRVRLVAPNGTITNVAGNGSSCATTACGDGGPATAAGLNLPTDVAVDAAGNVYIADENDSKVRKVTPGGTISTAAGNGTSCPDDTSPCGDGGSAIGPTLNSPQGVDVDTAGNLYIADTASRKVRMVTPGGTISTVAGDGTSCTTQTNPCGDGGSATAAQLASPQDVAIDGSGAVYIAGGRRVRKVSGGNITNFAGDGNTCSPSTDPCGDGGAATSANLANVRGVDVDANGTVHLSDGATGRVRKVAGGLISTIAGTGNPCSPATGPCGDGGAASAALLSQPAQLALDAAGNLYVPDVTANRVRWLTGPVGATGPSGAAGPAGTPGQAGGTGQQGTQGPQGNPGALVLFAFQARVTRTRVSVRYVLTHASQVSLQVARGRGAATTVARGRGRAGLNTISWNRRLRGRRAPAARYRLTVVATRDGLTARTRIGVRLR